MKKILLGLTALTAGMTVAVSGAQAEYPERSISVMVPFGAGGGTDVPARFFAAEMEKILGQNLVVSNVSGAGGTVGATQLSKAKADGYSLGFMPVGTTTTQPHLKKTKYNADSWAPVCLVAQGPYYLNVAKNSPIKTIEDYIAKAKSGGLKFGGPGPGSMPHVTQMLLDKALGIKSRYVPVSGGGGKIAAEVNGGRLDATVWFSDFESKYGYRAIALLNNKRSPDHPNVPTLKELGHDVSAFVWFGFFAPAGTPGNVVNILSNACGKAVATPTFAANMKKAKRSVRYMDTAEFTAFFRKSYKQNGELLRSAGLIK